MSDQHRPMRNTDYSWNVSLKAVPDHPGELYLTPGRLSGTTSQPFKHSTDAGRTWTTVPDLTGVTAFGYRQTLPRHRPPRPLRRRLPQRHLRHLPLHRQRHHLDPPHRLPRRMHPKITAIDADKTITGRVYLAIAGGTAGPTAARAEPVGISDPRAAGVVEASA